MSQKPSSKKKAFPIISVLGVGLLLAVVLAAGGFAFAASQESNDSFCASCHTRPESTFYQNSTAAQPVDLASFHTPQKTACIDCHSGQGVLGRMQAELLGASNAFKWYTGTAVQPAVLLYPITDQNCLKCHAQVTVQNFSPKETITVPGISASGRERGGRANHWHNLLAKWQAASASAGSCVSCHAGHAQGSTAQSGFMVSQSVQNTCNACHRVLRTDD